MAWSPPVKVVVAGEPKVAAPESALKERAAVVEVASAVDVAIYRVLLMLRSVHAFEDDVVSTRAS